MHIRVLKSPAERRNPDLVEKPRENGEDNLQWIRRIAPAKKRPPQRDYSGLLLVGGADPLSFRLRIAQSHVRHDLSPSAWSHVLFVRNLEEDALARSATIEISLMPSAGFGPFGYPVSYNGIQAGQLGAYQSAELFPNIALLWVPVAAQTIADSLTALQLQRPILDCPELILKWLAYCWGAGVQATPLAEGFGIPSAAVLEAAYAANGFDLTPGLESRSSCPEAIWQAASWWQDYYLKRVRQPIIGAYSAKHDLVSDKFYKQSAQRPGPAGEPEHPAPPSAASRPRRSAERRQKRKR
jgi:hypothetical protein